MRLLKNSDYPSVIQQTDLDQILEGVEQYRIDKEQVAQAEMISYLSQRYEKSEIFSDTTVWSVAVSYKAKNLVYVTASAYSASTAYAANSLMLFTDGYIYFTAAGTTAGQNPTTNPLLWANLGLDQKLYYITTPKPDYDYTVTYAKDDEVYYKNRTYKAKQPITNILPTNGNYWTDLGAYSVAAGVLPTDATKWTPGDNRNPQIVQYLIDITLFHLYKRINPRYIPDLRKEAYDGNGPTQSGGAIGWLKKVSKGEVNADLPKIAPAQGNSITWGNADGTQTRSSNQY